MDFFPPCLLQPHFYHHNFILFLSRCHALIWQLMMLKAFLGTCLQFRICLGIKILSAYSFNALLKDFYQSAEYILKYTQIFWIKFHIMKNVTRADSQNFVYKACLATFVNVYNICILCIIIQRFLSLTNSLSSKNLISWQVCNDFPYGLKFHTIFIILMAP